MTDRAVPPTPARSRGWAQVRRLAAPHRRGVLLLSMMSFVSGSIEAAFLVVIAPRAALAIADGRGSFGVLADQSASIGLGIAFAAGLLVVRLALGLASVRVSAGLTVDTLTEARHRLADAYLHTSWAVQHGEPSGRLQELVGSFAGMASGVVASLTLLLTAALTLVALIVVSLTVNPIATALVVVALVALVCLVAPLRRRIRARTRSAAGIQMAFATTVSELGALGLEMQSFGVREQFADRVRAAIGQDAAARRRVLEMQGALSPIYTCLAYGALLGGLAIASALQTGELGGAAAVMLVMMRSLSYGQQLQTALGAMAGMLPYVDLVDQTIEKYTTERAAGGDVAIDEMGPIVATDVSFSYVPGRQVLHGVSFRIEPGEVVGIIGPSGAGKSTLVQLLLGLREPSAGRIEINGVDLREAERRSWTARTAFVAQEALLFSGSVADNIAFFRDEIDRSSIERATRQAQIFDEIAAMPDGFDSAVGERGGQLSVGQRQRITIAHALAGDPQLIVMDEPTSALDARSAALIRRTLAELQGSVTVIIIAHRLSTLNVCDRITVLQEGGIVAMDTAESLAAKDPFYRESILLSGLGS